MDNQTNNNGFNQWEGAPQPQQAQQPLQHDQPQQYPQSQQPVHYDAQWGYTPVTPPVVPPYGDTQRPKRRFRSAMKTALTTVSFVRGVLAIILIFMLLIVVGSLFADPVYYSTPVIPSFSVIPIEGSIVGARSFGDYGYVHLTAMEYIKDLAHNPNDHGILLYMNTPGGTV